MAFTVGCLFILQCIFLMDISVADPLIDVSPSEINIGLTSTLDINCTFSLDNHPDMAGLISLVLSRANATGQHFEDLATITEFSPNSVNLLSQEKISATGVHSHTGESFLQLSWQYPTALQGGVYKCSANGVGVLGLNVEMTNTSLVTVDEANLNDIFEKLQQLEWHETSMSNTISLMKNRIDNLENKTQTLESNKLSLQQNIQSLENEKTSMEKHITNLEHNISRLEVVVASITGPHVDFLGSYGTKDYFLSSYAFVDINESIDVCKSLGGQLTVVNDQSELTAIQGFLKSTTGINFVYISGSDEKTEGNWVLSDSDTPLPFTSWWPGTPRTERSLNCLVLRTGPWSMYDYLCHFDSPFDFYRFMCEI